MALQGIFVTGTDTEVGKTIMCAGLMKLLHNSRKVRYWKPIQTGTVVGDDTADIRSMLEIAPDHFLEPVYRFPEPVSPQQAAKKWGKTIDINHLVTTLKSAVPSDAFVIVEGAGGLMVPLNDNELQLQLIRALGFPVLLVSEDRVGAINHALLSLRVCQEEKIKVLGLILTKSRGNVGNREAIAHFGKVEIFAEFPTSEDSKTTIAQVCGNQRLREILQLPSLP